MPLGDIPDAIKEAVVRNNLDSDWACAFFRGDTLGLLDSKRRTAGQLRRIANRLEEIALKRDRRQKREPKPPEVVKVTTEAKRQWQASTPRTRNAPKSRK